MGSSAGWEYFENELTSVELRIGDTHTLEPAHLQHNAATAILVAICPVTAIFRTGDPSLECATS
jgi:hypothetical protein